MRNIRENQRKTCIIKTSDEFDRDIRQITNGQVTVSYEMDGISFISENDDITEENIMSKLSELYRIWVTSIHIDDCDMIGVWICYKDIESLVNTIEIEIRKSLKQYSSEHIDVVIDEESDQLYITYHSDKDSFPCSQTLCSRYDVPANLLERLCDKYQIGHCW